MKTFSFSLILALNIRARHELLEGAIGVYPEEEKIYSRVTKYYWILPCLVITGAALDMILAFSYMKYFHPWKIILSFPQDKEKDDGEGEQSLPKDEDNTNAEVDIEEMFENVYKEILARQAKRDEALK